MGMPLLVMKLKNFSETAAVELSLRMSWRLSKVLEL